MKTKKNDCNEKIQQNAKSCVLFVEIKNGVKGMKKSVKRLSILLSVVLVWSCGFSVHAASNTETGLSDSLDLSSYTLEDIPASILDSMDLSGSQPLKLSEERAANLSAMTVEREDGSETLYSFAEPIKFLDGDQVRFKDNSIKNSGAFTYKYENASSDIKTYFPHRIQNGVKVTYDTHSVVMNPLASSNTPSTVNDNAVDSGIVEYHDVFSSQDRIQYIPINSGLKENIVLEEYTGQNDFVFELSLGDLVPRQMSGESIPLLDPDTQEITMFIGQVNAYDSSSEVKETWENFLSLEPTEESGVYELTVHVDSTFLSSSDTIYPVTIDPTVSVASSGLETVLTAEVNPDYNYISNSIFFVGEDGSGDCRTYVQATNLANYSYINPNNITSATFRAYCRSSQGANALSVRAYDTAQQWTPDTITYNNQPGVASWSSSAVTVSTTSRYYSFDVTYLAKKWISNSLGESGGWSYKYGFVLKSENEGTLDQKCFNSINHTENRPTLTITYTRGQTLENGVYYIKNVNSQKYMYATGSNVVQTSFDGGKWQQFQLTHMGNGYYTLSSVFYPNKNMTLEDVTTYNVGLDTASTTDTSQQFLIVQNNDSTGSYRMYNRWNAINSGVGVAQGSTSELANVLVSTYTGANSQKWVFERATTIGAARAYQAHSCNGASIGHYGHNCYWYAIGMPESGYSISFDVEKAQDVEKFFGHVKEMFEELNPGRTCRQLNSKDDLINSAKEYKVAIRTYYNPENNDPLVPDIDYHFVMQLNTGEWAHKPGSLASQNLGFVDPSDLTNTTIWAEYNSPVLYVAFTW